MNYILIEKNTSKVVLLFAEGVINQVLQMFQTLDHFIVKVKDINPTTFDFIDLNGKYEIKTLSIWTGNRNYHMITEHPGWMTLEEAYKKL